MTGRCGFFWIPGPDGKLASKTIFHRLSVTDVVEKEAFHHATVFFIECRNLHKVPSQLKGVCCALRLLDKKTRLLQYRLCYIWRYTPDRNCLQAFVWKGRTTGLVPDFFRLEGGAGALSVSSTLFSEHFHFVTLNSSLNDVVFLNQVHGPRSGLTRYSLYDSINPIDRCFQCSPEKPDVMYFPSTHAWSTKHIPDTYPHGFTTRALTHYDPQIPSTSAPDWSAYKRRVLLPVIPEDRSRQKRHHPKHKPAWTAPAAIFTLDDEIPIQVVYVQDSDRRLNVDSKHKKLIAMPYLRPELDE
jgi:hypothetical protein